MNRKFPIVKYLVLSYCISLIVLMLLEGYDITRIENFPSFVMLFIIPVIIFSVVVLAWFLKSIKFRIFRKNINIKTSFIELSGVTFLQLAFIFGLQFGWFNFTYLTVTEIVVFIFTTILPSVIFLLYLYIWYKSRKRKKSSLTEQEIVKVDEFIIKEHKKDILDYDKIIRSIGFTSDNITEKTEQSISIDIPSNHRFSEVFSRLKLQHVSSYKAIRLVLQLKSDSLISLEIRRRDSAFTHQKNEFSISRLDSVYVLNSPTPNVWKSLFNDVLLKEELLLFRPYLEHFSLKGQFIEALIYSENALVQILDWIMKLNPSMEKLSGTIKASKAEKMLCYNCQDPFDPLEENCSICGSPRPRCIVCFQDLKPEIDVDVVILPCCKIYAHKDHMVAWLREKPNCPNCHADLSRWLNAIRI